MGINVAGGLVVKALDCRLKGPRFSSLLGALSPTSKIKYKVFLRVLRRCCQSR